LASSRRLEPPEFDLSTAEGIEKAIDSVIASVAASDEEDRLKFVRALIAKFEKPKPKRQKRDAREGAPKEASA
jgi:hypothetical protein